mgnify:FL=1
MDFRTERKVNSIITQYIQRWPNCAIMESQAKYFREKEKNIILPGIKEKIEQLDNPTEISITTQWDKQGPDMSVCKNCKETIYGVQYQLSIFVCGEKVDQKKPVKLCEPCYLKKDL